MCIPTAVHACALYTVWWVPGGAHCRSQSHPPDNVSTPYMKRRGLLQRASV
ncbi:hypothetical protein PF005_g19387 [Phytophthora fragariae]|uniref:Uncharacterized protein n=1 Tax=Phytophthora fragariae TaxID=53985 RepID=A0A6A3EGT1_9STRA|nr:hypothetical protein PF003_g24328 [Phytophthora fragariae]KAE8931487.1 hypothetical protein PF009_g18459 [Phytophthora fragariae]KAE8990976.1 hypothetical protein PF011_g18132 [Phytophthora fragariae]KAE9095162.1 hypothetical protein PF010_g16814 [Phytophthora fragariae]KAE9097557.1 hypothetical protein PF007_g16570 [Phytophthora fragariae]